MSAPAITRAQLYGHDCLYCASPLDPWTAMPVNYPGGWDLFSCPSCCDWCGERDNDPIKPTDED